MQETGDDTRPLSLLRHFPPQDLLAAVRQGTPVFDKRECFALRVRPDSLNAAPECRPQMPPPNAAPVGLLWSKLRAAEPATEA